MPVSFNRRQFMKVATLGTVSLASGISVSRALADVAAHEPPLYVFPLLGDLHFDKPSHHDMDWVRREKPDDVPQIEGYIAGTEKYHPRLFASVRAIIAAQVVPVPFVVQVGDLVEGLCGSYDLQALQFRDAFEFLDRARVGAPILVTKGNHDITGPGAPAAFEKVLLPWLSKQAGQELGKANFVMTHGEDAFVFFDAYKPDLDWLDRTLIKYEGVRHLFFVIHPPVVPYNARSNWHVFAAEREKANRERLLALLGKHRAIVLSGHLHKYGLVNRRTESGSFVQLAVSSIVRNDHEVPVNALQGVEHYTPDLVTLEPRFAPTTLDQHRALLEAEKPFINRFEFADLPGYALVKVFADRVDVDLYAGAGDDRWNSRSLTSNPASRPA